ncbi:MAG TPA: hypothetical protein VGO52_15040, partial [Hyphomonadaceae bacterium]|nr:hypothetical protein [Hyphomonadaceae bacterium]
AEREFYAFVLPQAPVWQRRFLQTHAVRERRISAVKRRVRGLELRLLCLLRCTAGGKPTTL